MKKVILITGSSRGIGAATALLAAQEGYCTCVNYHKNAEAAQRVVQTIIDQGGKAIAVGANVSEESEVIELFNHIDQAFGPVTALVNNAGILAPQMSLSEMSGDRIEKVIRTNILSTFLCSREAVKRMSVKNGGTGGVIVNLSSRAAKLGAPAQYIDYAASKGAIDTFTIGLAKEVAQEGIRVNAVSPGFIATELHAAGGDPDRLAKVSQTIPMGRVGQANEIAEAILWLLSPKASYVTGTILDVAGGR